VQNSYGPGDQAVALRISGDRSSFYGCRFLGYQDTVLDESGRHYFKNCFIEGAADFICGDGQSLYEVNSLNTNHAVFS
jgi:pectinesterase